MRIAILLPGQPRFTKDFTNFLTNLKGYDSADWFCYITNNNRTDDVSQDVSISNEWMTFDPTEAKNRLQSYLPNNNHIRAFEISNCEEIAMPAIPRQSHYKGWYNIYRANQLRLSYGQEYDMVIRARSDVGINEPFNLQNIDPKALNQSIIMPGNQWAGAGGYEACDQFAICSPDHMNIYADLANKVEGYLNENLFGYNPEALLGLHLSRNNVPTVKGEYTISLRWA
jgi:hypothetical protein